MRVSGGYSTALRGGPGAAGIAASGSSMLRGKSDVALCGDLAALAFRRRDRCNLVRCVVVHHGTCRALAPRRGAGLFLLPHCAAAQEQAGTRGPLAANIAYLRCDWGQLLQVTHRADRVSSPIRSALDSLQASLGRAAMLQALPLSSSASAQSGWSFLRRSCRA